MYVVVVVVVDDDDDDDDNAVLSSNRKLSVKPASSTAQPKTKIRKK